MSERSQMNYKEKRINSTYFSEFYKHTKIMELNYSWPDRRCVHIVAIIGK